MRQQIGSLVGDLLYLVSVRVIKLGVQQCFGVVYHELITLIQIYFARAALAAHAKYTRLSVINS